MPIKYDLKNTKPIMCVTTQFITPLQNTWHGKDFQILLL